MGIAYTIKINRWALINDVFHIQSRQLGNCATFTVRVVGYVVSGECAIILNRLIQPPFRPVKSVTAILSHPHQYTVAQRR